MQALGLQGGGFCKYESFPQRPCFVRRPSGRALRVCGQAGWLIFKGVCMEDLQKLLSTNHGRSHEQTMHKAQSHVTWSQGQLKNKMGPDPEGFASAIQRSKPCGSLANRKPPSVPCLQVEAHVGHVHHAHRAEQLSDTQQAEENRVQAHRDPCALAVPVPMRY